MAELAAANLRIIRSGTRPPVRATLFDAVQCCSILSNAVRAVAGDTDAAAAGLNGCPFDSWTLDEGLAERPVILRGIIRFQYDALRGGMLDGRWLVGMRISIKLSEFLLVWPAELLLQREK